MIECVWLENEFVGKCFELKEGCDIIETELECSYYGLTATAEKESEVSCIWIKSETIKGICKEVKKTCDSLLTEQLCEYKGIVQNDSSFDGEIIECTWLNGEDGKCFQKVFIFIYYYCMIIYYLFHRIR
jgi:hypothetical protein